MGPGDRTPAARLSATAHAELERILPNSPERVVTRTGAQTQNIRQIVHLAAPLPPYRHLDIGT